MVHLCRHEGGRISKQFWSCINACMHVRRQACTMRKLLMCMFPHVYWSLGDIHACMCMRGCMHRNTLAACAPLHTFYHRRWAVRLPWVVSIRGSHGTHACRHSSKLALAALLVIQTNEVINASSQFYNCTCYIYYIGWHIKLLNQQLAICSCT